MYYMKEKVTITIDKKILRNVDAFIDRLYIRNRSQAIESLLEKRMDENKTAVILATGPSENLRISKDEFRATARIGKTTTIEFAIKNLRQNNFKKIFIVGEQPVLTAIFSLIGDGRKYGISIKYVDEENSPGTADSLRLLKDELKTTFLVVFGDIVFKELLHTCG